MRAPSLILASILILIGFSTWILGFVADLLAEASERTDRCWVIADHERPHWLDGVRLAGVVDLGD